MTQKDELAELKARVAELERDAADRLVRTPFVEDRIRRLIGGVLLRHGTPQRRGNMRAEVQLVWDGSRWERMNSRN